MSSVVPLNPIIPHAGATLAELINHDISVFGHCLTILNGRRVALCFSPIPNEIMGKYIKLVAKQFNMLTIYLGPKKYGKLCVINEANLKPHVKATLKKLRIFGKLGENDDPFDIEALFNKSAELDRLNLIRTFHDYGLGDPHPGFVRNNPFVRPLPAAPDADAEEDAASVESDTPATPTQGAERQPPVATPNDPLYGLQCDCNDLHCMMRRKINPPPYDPNFYLNGANLSKPPNPTPIAYYQQNIEFGLSHLLARMSHPATGDAVVNYAFLNPVEHQVDGYISAQTPNTAGNMEQEAYNEIVNANYYSAPLYNHPYIDPNNAIPFALNISGFPPAFGAPESLELDYDYIKWVNKYVDNPMIICTGFDYKQVIRDFKHTVDCGVELYDFPNHYQVGDIVNIFPNGFGAVYVEKCDDTHAVFVTTGPKQVLKALSIRHPDIKSRPLLNSSLTTMLKLCSIRLPSGNNVRGCAACWGFPWVRHDCIPAKRRRR